MTHHNRMGYSVRILAWLWGALCLSCVARAFLSPPLLDPTLMPPSEIAEEATIVTNEPSYVDLSNGPLKQKGIQVRLAQATTSVTYTCWIRLENAKNYIIPLPCVYPQEVFSTGQKYPCQTIYGPASGSGTTTLPITVPDDATLPSQTLAFNLTTETEATLSAGYASKTLPAGETLGSHLKAKPGAAITITTTGTWELELAIPPQVRVYAFISNQGSNTSHPVFPADNQWALVAAHMLLDTDTGTLSFTYRTLYADGCQVDYANGNDTPFYSITMTQPCPLQAIPSGAIITPFAIYSGPLFSPPDTSASALAHAYGLKAWRGEISDDFLQTIRAKDAAEMVKRGLLTPADCTHETTEAAAASTFSLRARALSIPKTHSPGNPPPSPAVEETENGGDN